MPYCESCICPCLCDGCACVCKHVCVRVCIMYLFIIHYMFCALFAGGVGWWRFTIKEVQTFDGWGAQV
jgi:hypothetical protein